MRDYHEKVRMILVEHPETRDDDMKLYAWFVYKIVSLDKKVSFYSAMYHHERYNLPSYESVTRARRKIQEVEPELQGNRRAKRLEEEETYRQFYGR